MKFSKKKSSKERREQLGRVFRHSRGQAARLRRTLEEEVENRDEIVGVEIRAGMSELDASYADMERRLNARSDRYQEGEAAAVRQQTYLQGQLRSKEKELEDLRNGRAIVPLLRLLEREPKFRNALAIYLDTNDRRLYVSPGFLESFKVSEGDVLSGADYFPDKISSRLKKKVVTEVQGEKFEVEPVKVSADDGSHIGTYLQFHPQGPIDKLKEKIHSARDAATTLKELFLGLHKGSSYEQ